MALNPTPTAVKVDPPMGTVTDDLLDLPGEKVVVEQPSGAFTVDIADDNVMKPVPATAITFTVGAVAVALGQWTQLFVNFDPSYTGDKNIVWSVDDETLATIDANGVITGLKDGEVTVTAAVKSQPTVKATATVTVGAGAPNKSIAGKTIASATGGDVITFAKLFTAGNGATADDFTFKVNPTAAGTVADDGSLTLADDASGKVTVVATAKSGTTVDGSPATGTITEVTPKPEG